MNPIPFIESNNTILTDQYEIAEKFVHSFAQTSSSTNYSREFLAYKENVEATPLQAIDNSDNTEDYNSDI